MNLKCLLGDYPYLKIVGSIEIDITGINHDSRKINKDELFIAKKGINADGHKYIQAAIANKASCIILEDNLDIEIISGVTYIWVNNSMDAIAYLSSKFYNNPGEKLFLIGITGTNGKTSTSYLVNSILSANNIKTGIIGTTGGIIDGDITKLDNTTPDPIVLHYNLNKMVNNNLKACVMEVSSHALDLKRVEYIDFDIGIFTNLTKDHLDYHLTMENYFNSKIKLFFKTTKCNIVNIDDHYGKEIVGIVKDRISLITYGIDNKADIYATDIEYSMDKVKFILNDGNKSIDIILNTPGKFSVYNALAAATCGFAMGIDIGVIKLGLENIKGIKGRFEVVPIDRDYTVIIDFAHTADGLEKVLAVIEQFADGRKIVVFGAGGNRDKTKRPEMGETVGLHSDFAIVTSDNPRFEDPISIIEDVVVGIKKTDVKYEVIVDRKEAIKYALDNAKSKDIILLAGKGHETYTIIGNNIYPFDERQIVLDYLKDK